jgi:hypothetical protein
MENPYGDGTAAVTIARILTTAPLDRLLVKQPAPLPDTIAATDSEPR